MIPAKHAQIQQVIAHSVLIAITKLKDSLGNVYRDVVIMQVIIF